MSDDIVPPRKQRAPIQAPTGPTLQVPPKPVAAPAPAPAPQKPTREELLAKCRAAGQKARYGKGPATAAAAAAAGITELPKRKKDIEKVVKSLRQSKDPAVKQALAATTKEFVEECGGDISQFCEKHNIQPDAMPAIQELAGMIEQGMPLADALQTLGSLA